MSGNSKHQVAFDQLGLGSILKRYQLMVPPNQRNYTWDEREVKQLFQDLTRAIDDGDYFLGTIVTIPRDNDVLELVDGQQRLATTALLLAAIRDYMVGKEDMIVESINNEFLTGIDRTQRKRLPKLRLNIDDNELFSCIITGEGDIGTLSKDSRESHRMLLQAQSLAQKHVKNIVSPYDGKDHGNVLNSWISFLEHRALVVQLTVPNKSDAFRMFETLNDRGVRTNQSDLIKNYLFGSSHDRFDEVQNRWAYMRGALESLSDEDITIDFIRYSLTAIQGYVTEAEIYERIQNKVKSAHSALEFATTLENLSNVYVATFNPEHERWSDYPESTSRAIHVFGIFDIKPMRALILAISSKMDTNEAVKSFDFLISLGVRLLIAFTTRSGGVITPLGNSANKVFTGSIKTSSELKKDLASITPSNAVFMKAFETAKVSNASFARYYLRALELASKNDKEPWYLPVDDPSIINLEHVLPKKPEGNWPNFSDEEVSNYVNRIGNQALIQTSKNSNIKSADFAAKKNIYKDAQYTLTKQIAEYEDWTPDSISKRQSELSELSVIAWPI
jgi:hypothetical protein